MEARIVARRAVVRGRVHGVGFRVSTRELARRLGVVGWVRNRPDGTVAMHVEGRQDDVEALLEWAHDGPRWATVVGVESEDVEPDGLESFRVL